MSAWDDKLLKYGERFEKEMMSLAVNLTLEEALDGCWKILSSIFEPQEVGISSKLVEKYWRSGE